MGALVYIQLIGYTAGTLLMLFWMVVILGYRRQRNFERVFFFLCLALFLFYAGSLLALNAKIHYRVPPAELSALAGVFVLVGLCMLPPLLVHVHLEFAETRGLIRSRQTKRWVLSAFYVPILYFGLSVYGFLAAQSAFDLTTPGRLLGRAYGVWLVLALTVGCYWELKFSLTAPERPQSWFHKQLGRYFLLIVVIVLYLHFVQGLAAAGSEITTTILALLAIPPFAILLEMVFRFHFLNIGGQRNLVYAVSVVFLALLYLAFVRRVALWLEPLLPPEATAAILVFVLVIFIEPLQRVLTKQLRAAAQSVMDRVQKLMTEIQLEARQGDPSRLLPFIERRIQEQFELRQAQIVLYTEVLEGKEVGGTVSPKPCVKRELAREPRAAIPFNPREFPIHQESHAIGVLCVEPHGAGISGETAAALEFLCEQLPGALDLCRLIEEKVRLERELAERERLAALGQMAASISHNLKNPLGSMKTILQVQLENPELPESLRGETRLVLDEINRLSAKLNQLLQFSRPAMAGTKRQAGCDAAAVTNEIMEVLRHEAERKGVTLEIAEVRETVRAQASAEAVNDIVTNLAVNAIEAAPRGGRVIVQVLRKNDKCLVSIEDDGPGVPAELQGKILEPFWLC